jgi:hypothetical protein
MNSEPTSSSVGYKHRVADGPPTPPTTTALNQSEAKKLMHAAGPKLDQASKQTDGHHATDRGDGAK